MSTQLSATFANMMITLARMCEGGIYDQIGGGFARYAADAGTPGGGRIGPNTHLSERFRLIDGGKKLSVTFTWTDHATNEEGYRVLRDDEVISELPANTTSFADSYAFAAGEKIVYQIEVYNRWLADAGQALFHCRSISLGNVLLCPLDQSQHVAHTKNAAGQALGREIHRCAQHNAGFGEIMAVARERDVHRVPRRQGRVRHGPEKGAADLGRNLALHLEVAGHVAEEFAQVDLLQVDAQRLLEGREEPRHGIGEPQP